MEREQNSIGRWEVLFEKYDLRFYIVLGEPVNDGEDVAYKSYK